MSELKATPGPWEIGPMHKTIRPKGFDCIGAANGGCIIAKLFGRDAVANANLVNSAHDLYERLSAMAVQHKCGCEHPACNRCQDDAENERALARARGETEGELI